MRKLIFYLISTVIILILVSSGFTQGLPSLIESSPASSPPTTDLASPPIIPSASTTIVSVPNIYSYTDPDYSFKFSYPENWEPYEDIDTSGTYKAEIDLFEGDYIIAAFAVYAEKYQSSLASYAISVEEWMMNPQNMPEYYKIKEEAVTVGGIPAIERFYTWTKINKEDNTKIPIKAVDVYLVKNDKGYILEGQTIKEKFEQLFPQLEAIINSFSLPDMAEGSTPSVSSITSVVTTTETPSLSTISSISEGIVFKFCPYCGVPVQLDYKFCPECGKSLAIQRTIKAPEKAGLRSDKETRINYPVNLTQSRGFLKELNQSDYSRETNKSYNKPYNSFKPGVISQSFVSPLISIFPKEPILPWAVTSRVVSGYYDYGKIFSNSTGEKISAPLSRDFLSGDLKFSYLEKLGTPLTFNLDLEAAFRRRATEPLNSSLKNLGKSITYHPIEVSEVPLSMKSWALRGVGRGVEGDILMGSSIKNLDSKVGMVLTEQTRSSWLGESLSILGQGISSEIGTTREAETLPSLTPTPQQNEQILPIIPPSTGPEGIISPTPGAPAQGGINLTPPGQPAQIQPGTEGITLPTPGTPQEPEIIWKQYSLNQAFGHNPLITGYLEYPSSWLINLDSFNRSVTFSEDTGGLTALILFPGLMGQFSSAQDLAQQVTYLLQQRVPELSIINQEFKIVPTPGSGAIEVTEGKVQLQGTYQGTVFRFNIETYVIYTGVYGPSSGMGYAILLQSPQNIFIEKEQKYFNRMILSYKRALGVAQ